MANEFDTKKRQLEKQNTYYKQVTEAYQKVLNEDYKGNLYHSEGVKLARTKSLTADSKDLQGAIKLKHELNSLIREYEHKESSITGGARGDTLKSSQIRDQYMVDNC